MFLLLKDNALLTNRTIQTLKVPKESIVLQIKALAASKNKQLQKQRRDLDESISLIQQKINALQADLAALEHEHKMQKLCKAASQ